MSPQSWTRTNANPHTQKPERKKKWNQQQPHRQNQPTQIHKLVTSTRSQTQTEKERPTSSANCTNDCSKCEAYTNKNGESKRQTRGMTDNEKNTALNSFWLVLWLFHAMRCDAMRLPCWWCCCRFSHGATHSEREPAAALHCYAAQTSVQVAPTDAEKRKRQQHHLDRVRQQRRSRSIDGSRHAAITDASTSMYTHTENGERNTRSC